MPPLPEDDRIGMFRGLLSTVNIYAIVIGLILLGRWFW